MSTASGDDYIVADPVALVSADEVLVVAPAAQNPRLQWPFLLVALVCGAGLAFVAAGALREGVAAVVISLALATALRLMLPSRTAGWLSSRSRVVDTACFAAAAVGLAGTLFLLR